MIWPLFPEVSDFDLQRLTKAAKTAHCAIIAPPRHSKQLLKHSNHDLVIHLQAREGVITLTNPDMTRFWLSVEQAVELIATALSLSGGSILIPRLGSATMRTVAHAASEMEMGEDIDLKEPAIQVIGQRVGEQVHEDLLGPQERIYATAFPHIFRLFPVCEGPRQSAHPEPYSSDRPDTTIGMATMLDLIKGATE